MCVTWRVGTICLFCLLSFSFNNYIPTTSSIDKHQYILDVQQMPVRESVPVQKLNGKRRGWAHWVYNGPLAGIFPFLAIFKVMLQVTQFFRICLFAIRCRSALGQRLPPRRTAETTTCSRLNLTMSHSTYQHGRTRRLFHDSSKFFNCIRSGDGVH